MSDTQQTPSAGSEAAGSEAAGSEAAAELAEIQRRHRQVVKAVLVPVWYWWAMAAGMVVIGAARDSGDPVVQAIAIPLAALVMVGLTGAMIPAVRRRVQVHSARQPGGRGAAPIAGLIILVDAVTIGATVGLVGAEVSHPVTIGCVAGAAVLVIAGPLANRYLRSLMLNPLRQQMNEAPAAGSTA